MPPSNSHWFSEIFKDKVVKFFVRVLLGIICFYLLYVLLGAVFNFKVGGPLGQKESRVDTVFRERITTSDTNATDSPANKIPPKTIIIPPQKENDKSKPSVEQKNKNGKNEVNENNGVNNGNMGGSGNTVNNYGIIPRMLSEKEVMAAVNSQTEDKNIFVRFWAYNSIDAEIESVKNQIVAILKRNGFTNIDNQLGFTTRPEPLNSINIALFKGERVDELRIHIPAARPDGQ